MGLWRFSREIRRVRMKKAGSRHGKRPLAAWPVRTSPFGLCGKAAFVSGAFLSPDERREPWWENTFRPLVDFRVHHVALDEPGTSTRCLS